MARFTVTEPVEVQVPLLTETLYVVFAVIFEATGFAIVASLKPAVGVQLYVNEAGEKVYVVPVGKFAAELMPVFSVVLLAVEVFAGDNGVTLKKDPTAPEIPIDAEVLVSAADVLP